MRPITARNFELWFPLPLGLLAGGGAGLLAYWLLPGLAITGLILVAALVSAAAAGIAGIYMQRKGLGEIARLLTRIGAGQNVSEHLHHGFPAELQTEIKGVQDTWAKDRSQLTAQLENLRQASQEQVSVSMQGLALLENHLEKIRKKAKSGENTLERLGKIITINKSLIASDVEMSSSVHEIAADVKLASQTANDGIKSVGHEIRAMSDLRTTVGSSTSIIAEFNNLAKHIQEFVTRIGGISRQTHLLSLNAGIEAARAGESGRGFAVVASEIRTLSESSKQATVEVTGLIHEIHRRTDEVIKILKNTDKLEENIKVVYTAGDTFMNIVRGVKEIDARVNHIEQLIDESATDGQLIDRMLSELKQDMDESRDMEQEPDSEMDEYLRHWRQRLELFRRNTFPRGE
ncbi:MAG: hypothetical protein HGA76_03095 [Candidatus Firestonebacteria bacterium]|nr:hypothetical protein [Candidatus Firestonebacteria bacterium]